MPSPLGDRAAGVCVVDTRGIREDVGRGGEGKYDKEERVNKQEQQPKGGRAHS